MKKLYLLLCVALFSLSKPLEAQSRLKDSKLYRFAVNLYIGDASLENSPRLNMLATVKRFIAKRYFIEKTVTVTNTLETLDVPKTDNDPKALKAKKSSPRKVKNLKSQKIRANFFPLKNIRI